jgi:hypothetical protein
MPYEVYDPRENKGGKAGESTMLKRIAFAALGLTLVAAFGVFLYRTIASPPNCDVCYRPIHEETFYRIHLASGESMDVCCPRCGLRFQEGRRDIVRAEATDFYTKVRIDAAKGSYVENSHVHLCSHSPVQEDRSGTQYEVAWDRCLPSLIAFESPAEARAFQAQNGGVIKSYDELFREGSP